MFHDDNPQGRPRREQQTLDRPHQLLLDAAALIEKHGWCQNELRSAQGALCINGAVQMAAGVPISEFGWSDDALAAVTLIRRAVHIPAWCWNDCAIRTKEEVVAKLRVVALGG